MAGTRDPADGERIRRALNNVWRDVPAVVTHDLEVALAAADEQPGTQAKVLVLSGTGSCCYGRGPRGGAKVGGWGHLLGDLGSGYHIAHEALRAVIYEFDRDKKWGPLGERLLRSLSLNEPNELIPWIQSADKSQIAALAASVFESKSDATAKKILHRAAASLAHDAILCAARIVSKRKPVAFILAGGVLLKQPAFAKQVGTLIREQWPSAQVAPLRKEGAWGAALLARKAAKTLPSMSAASNTAPRRPAAPFTVKSRHTWYVPEFIPSASPTEQRNPASVRFHELSNARMVELMLAAEQDVIPALLTNKSAIIRAVDLAAKTLQRGGRIFYAGAGTSGRLGVLDASECPPTFRASPEMIQGIIAGGQRALWQAVEGAEDNPDAGASALKYRRLTGRDLVIGIAASGRTPFVWGALGYARKVRARTILLCFNPSLQIVRAHRPDLVIAPNLGPEILTGSTRLKSGTATKLVLNMISTIAMVRLGKVISNLMVDLNPSNIKLRDRAIRILRDLTGCTPEQAKATLERNAWVVKKAWGEITEYGAD